MFHDKIIHISIAFDFFCRNNFNNVIMQFKTKKVKK